MIEVRNIEKRFHGRPAVRNLSFEAPNSAITGGRDVPTVRSLRVLLERMRDAGACIIFSSHVLEEARALCDQVVIISEGALVAQGPPEELCRQAAAPTSKTFS